MKTRRENVTAFEGGDGAVNDPIKKCTLTKFIPAQIITALI